MGPKYINLPTCHKDGTHGRYPGMTASIKTRRDRAIYYIYVFGLEHPVKIFSIITEPLYTPGMRVLHTKHRIYAP